MKNKISRRDFLKGAAAGAASLAAAGVLGACASDTQATTAATEAPTQASEAPAPAASASSDTWYDAAYFAKPAPITDIAETVDTEIVVIGAGNGGCVAAVSAADLGAKVV